MSNLKPQPEDEEIWEMHVQQAAQDFNYPPTPDIAKSLRRPRQILISQRLVQAAAVLVLALIVMMAVPEIRASMIEFLRLGAVRIFPVEQPQMPTLTFTVYDASIQLTPAPLTSVLDLPNEMRLDAAREQAPFSVYLPDDPHDFGLPDRIFLQQLPAPMLSLVWLDASAPDGIGLSLHTLKSSDFAGKWVPQEFQTTEVHNSRAIWLTQPHIFSLFPDHAQLGPRINRIIRTNVLIWQASGLTYRLETDSDLQEAINIAEALSEMD